MVMAPRDLTPARQKSPIAKGYGLKLRRWRGPPPGLTPPPWYCPNNQARGRPEPSSSDADLLHRHRGNCLQDLRSDLIGIALRVGPAILEIALVVVPDEAVRHAD